MWRITGYSSVMPLAPRIVRASRATSSAARTLSSLPNDDLPRAERARVLQRAEMQAQQLRLLSSTSFQRASPASAGSRAIGLAELHARLGVLERGLQHARAAPTAPHTMP